MNLSEQPLFDTKPSAYWNRTLPFSRADFPFSLLVQGRRLPSWGYWQRSRITDNPPPSPIDCAEPAACGEVTTLRLVPFGGTNIRISVFPWYKGQEQDLKAA